MIGNQLSAARALLGWTQKQLAEAAGVSIPTIKRAEGAAKATVSSDAQQKIKSTLQAAGVEFIPENGGGLGVRLVR
ncbi:helix-turn-helix transcriptional regulator [Tritonibacter mobilis]|uniref:helix-turn-helix transcriptional regulator n=1 Tax=Tritonibacter mobilis TaxID=379347 RepID=UPI000806DE23|nr:helix-turn-helix domain-containing protein [Tritonibacter mobilis]